MFGSAEKKLDAWGFRLLLTTVALAPLPLASNRPLPSSILTLAAGLTLLLACLAALLRDDAKIASWPLKIAGGAFLLVALFVLFQLATFLPRPLPHPLWSEASRILGRPLPGRITLDADLTWTTLTATSGYFALGFATILLLRGDRRFRTAALVLCVSGGLYALYGLLMWATGLNLVLWFPNVDYPGVVTATFINRNNYATYAGMVSLVAVAVVMAEVAELRHIGAANTFQRIVRTAEIVFRRQWPMVLSLVCTIPSLLFTLSRGGLAAFFVGTGLLLVLLARTNVLPRQWRGRSLIFFAVTFVCAIVLFDQAFLERLSQKGASDDSRSEAWSITIDGIETSPLLGHGFGAFREGFPLYRDDRLPSRKFWDKAHNTYLELAFDLGVPATILLLGGFLALGAQISRGLARRRRERRVLPAAGLAAMALAGTHSLIDFSLQIPADAVTFAFIVGLATAESGLWRGSPRNGPGND